MDTDPPHASVFVGSTDNILLNSSCVGYSQDAELCQGDDGNREGDDFDARSMCCACGGGSNEEGWTTVISVSRIRILVPWGVVLT